MNQWYRQKTFWSGVALIVAGIGAAFTADPATGNPISNAIQLIINGLAVIFMRQAIGTPTQAK